MIPSDNSETPSMATPPEGTDELKRKLVEMEAKASALENELNSLRQPKMQPGREAWVSRFILAIVLILAVIPPALVVADMWLRHPLSDLDGGTWCQVPFLCASVLPSYFAIILWCFFILAIIMFYVRRKTMVVQENPLTLFENPQIGPEQMRIGFRLLVISGLGMIWGIVWSFISQRWPGWDLVIVWLLYLTGWAVRAVSPTLLVSFWKKNGEFWVALLLMHMAIVVTLAAYYNVTQIFYLSLLLLVFAFGNLWRFRQRVPTIFWIISISLVLYCININAWWTAVIGDDYTFHDFAWNLAEKTSFAQIGEVLFRADGVFSAHPYFSSIVQAISMRFLGHESFGWRFSSLYLCAIGVGLFYFFCKSFISQRSALIAACLLAFSHYVMSFGKIGYNNLQALFALSLVLAAATWALRWKQPCAFALLGSAIALCFYLYPAALYVVPVPILLLLMYYPPKSRQAVGRWLVMIIVWLAMLYPLMLQPIYWQAKTAGTMFNRPELMQSIIVITQHFAYNIFYSIFSFLYSTEGHYIAVSFIDPITAIFILLGYFVLLYQIRRQRFAVFVALVFVFFLFTVGSSHDREVPPTTRMFLMLPLFALFGMWGLTWVEENIKKAHLFVDSKTVLVPVLLVAIAGANLYQAYKISPDHFAPTQSAETLFIGVTQDIQRAEPTQPKNIVILVGDVWGIDGFIAFQSVYPHLAWFHLYQIKIEQPALPGINIPLLLDRNTLIIVSPYLDPAWQNALDASLLNLGKIRCDVKTPAEALIPAQQRFALYYAPDMPDACPTY